MPSRAARRFDLLNVRIEATIDYARRSVQGRVSHRMILLSDSLPFIRLDADRGMSIGRVTINGEETHAELDSESLRIAIGSRYRRGDTVEVEIPWWAQPTAGLYFKGNGTPESPCQVWTQGQDDLHHHWVPIYDRPDDLTATEVAATVPLGWKVLSNGRLVSCVSNNDSTATWTWREEVPHATYLITVAAGPFHVARDTVDGLPLEYWVAPADSQDVLSTFGRTPRIIRFLSGYLGVPYPWTKYAQIVVEDFMHGGMENASATTLTAGVVVTPGSVDYTPDGILAHEIAHQWFGDLVTNRTWKDRWLHESFAEYLELRALRDLYGENRFIEEYRRRERAAIGFDISERRAPLVGDRWATENIYYRGAVVLHMLNSLIGDDAFRRGCRLFLERHRHANVETEDLRRAFEEASGRSLEAFFRQWIYGAGHPRLVVETEHFGRRLILTVNQTQARDSLTGIFTIDLPVVVECVNGIRIDTLLPIRADSNRFTLDLPSETFNTMIDPGWTIFKELACRRSINELIASLKAPWPTARIEAAIGLQKLKAGEFQDEVEAGRRIEELMHAYQGEALPVVREEIIRAAAQIGGVTRRGAILVQASADTARDIRRAVIGLADEVPDPDFRVRLLRPFLEDVSDVVASEALAAIALSDTANLEKSLERLKNVRGRQGRIADTWLAAVAAGRFVGFLDDVAGHTRPPFGENTRSYAFDVLGALGSPAPAALAAIRDGIRSDEVIIRAAAAICARKLMGPEMRAMLERLKSEVYGEQRATVDGLLEKN